MCPAIAAQAGTFSGASMTVANWPRGRDVKEKANEEASRAPQASTLTERRYKAVHSQNAMPPYLTVLSLSRWQVSVF
jgi:hypothetical protein